MQLAKIYALDRPAISFELFPPKKWHGMAELFNHFQELAKCGPTFVTCTYGAGGTTQQSTLDILRLVAEEYPHIPTASHLTCVGASVDQLRDYLRQAEAQGVKGIVALRGDPPKGETEFQPAPNGLRYADELVSLLVSEFPELSVLVAGYPEKHPEAPSMEADIDRLKHKVDAGAHAIITQLFYNNDDFFRFRDQCDKAGIRVPIIPGVLPITNLAQIERITAMCGAKLPEKLHRRLQAHRDDEEGQFSVGLYYAARQVEQLVEQGAPGIHFYVLNKSRAAAMICRALALGSKPE